MTHVLPLKRLPRAYAALLVPLFLSIVMSAVVSAAAIAVNTGFAPAALHAWPKAWAISWIVAFPSLLLLLPTVRRIVARMVEAPKG